MYKKLFIPGPTHVVDEILEAMAVPMIGHRDSLYSDMHGQAVEKLKKLLYTNNRIYLSTSSSTGMMEGAIRNCVKTKALMTDCGAFSKRWAQIATANGKETEVIKVEMGEAITPEMVDEYLAQGGFDSVCITHNETSTGVTNPIKEIAALVKEKYPPGTVITGKVRNLTNYGAFIQIEEGIDGLLHVSDMSWTSKITHPSEMLKKGDEIQCVVLSVDEEKKRIALGLKQLTEDPWIKQIPEHYIPGQIVKGKVTKITNFGVFVELEEGLEGLLHISELADHKVDKPEEIVKVGSEIEVKILRVDSEERKIALSLKRAQWAAEDGLTGKDASSSQGQVRRRGGLGADSGLLGAMENEPMLSITQMKESSETTQDNTTDTKEAELSDQQEKSSDETPRAEKADGDTTQPTEQGQPETKTTDDKSEQKPDDTSQQG